ncbi:flagellar motor switch protein [Salipiger sp. P9]|uniref:flagellar motor switch protein n=1 Tax=Salipiger pentaromativorans TaxID=2943193 RepID=UPI0021579556|nr:flagellar motor switch protein [Salipiger pentaromativorans]MCR8550515.1 flagellar motor switch protein [Salipiger pentaromativorans]
MSFAIDVAILVLLAGTMAYAWIVDRRVRLLMQVLKDMEPMIGTFSAAVDRSESTVSALRSIGQPPLGSPRQPAPEAPREEPAFRTTRERPSRPIGATPVPGKSELVRGFFETVRQREA